MGVLYYNTYGRPHELSNQPYFSAAATARLLNNGGNNISLYQIGQEGFNPSKNSNIGMEGAWTFGATGVPGVAYRYIKIGASNCQINIAYPNSGMASILYHPGNNNISASNRTYITSSEYSNGFRLYCRAINYTSYSFLQLSVNNFDYGYSAGSWIWYNAAGSFQTSFGSGTSSQSLYIGDYTSNSYDTLVHFAS